MASGWEDDVGPLDGHLAAPIMQGPPQHLAESVPGGFAVRIRGIPFQESEHTVHKWLQERGVTVRNGVLGIHFVYSDKRQWSGDAYATLQTDKDMELALAHDQAQMNHRYLEIFPCSVAEMEDALKQTGWHRLPNDYTVRLRGLEYKVTRENVQDFFKGLEIASGLDGIFIIKSHDGRTTGEAYVLFENKSAVERAVQKHKEKMGDRYVEIFLASSAHLRDALSGDGGRSRGRDQTGYGRGGQTRNREDDHCGRGGHAYQAYQPHREEPPLQPNYYQGFYPPNDAHYGAQREPSGPLRAGDSFEGYDHGAPAQVIREPGFRLYMRGLPWSCNQIDIERFFGEIKTKKVTKNMSDSNVFDGSAWVEFDSEADWMAGKRLHKGSMGHRYIELFTEQEVEEKRLGTKTGRTPANRGERGGRSARGGREGTGPRGGGGNRHGTSRGGVSPRGGGQSDYGRVGGPRTPYERPLQFRPQDSAPNAFSGYSSQQQPNLYASYTSFQHQPIQGQTSPPVYNNANGPPVYGNGNGAPVYGNGNNASASYGYTPYTQYPSILPGVGDQLPPGQMSMHSAYPPNPQQYSQQNYGVPPSQQGMPQAPSNISYSGYPAP